MGDGRQLQRGGVLGLDLEGESRWPRKEGRRRFPAEGTKQAEGTTGTKTEVGRAGLAPWAPRRGPVQASGSPFHPKPTFSPPLCFLCCRLCPHPRSSAWRAMAWCNYGQAATVKLGSHFLSSPSLRIGNVTRFVTPPLPTQTSSSPFSSSQ